VKYLYIIVIGICVGFIGEHYHWPYLIAIALILMVNTFAFFVAGLVEDDRR
jgi:hypothetical protein